MTIHKLIRIFHPVYGLTDVH